MRVSSDTAIVVGVCGGDGGKRRVISMIIL